MPGRPVALLILASAAIAFVLVATQQAGPSFAGQAFVVTKTADTNDGACDADCSLREAIIAANNSAGADVINVPAGTYMLTIAGSGEDAAATGDLDITDDLVAEGADAATTTVNAAGLDRVFDVFGLISVEIRGLTITGGLTTHDASRNGGGIQNSDATLTLEDVIIRDNTTGDFNGASGAGLVNVDAGVVTINNSVISNNQAPNSNNTGGGIANTESGTMTINESTISGNTAQGDGGGVINSNVGFMTINNTTISENQGRFGGGFSHSNGATAVINDSTITGNQATDGGGVEDDQGTTLTINRSTISGNTATDEGGGVYIGQSGIVTINDSTISENQALFGGGVTHEGSETVTINNSTISGNSADDNGGGVESFSEGTVSIANSTITNNTADDDSDGSGDGGGVRIGSGAIQVRNTIIAGNNDPTSDPDCFGTLTSLGYNLIGIESAGCDLTGDETGNVSGNALLGPLADNGGPTLTHTLLAGSPAIDAGSPDCPPPAADQRGFSRPRDGDDDQAPVCDIGAVEVGGAPPQFEAIWGDDNCSGGADPVDSLLTLRHDAGLATNTGDCPDMGEVVEVALASPHPWGDADCSGGIDPIDSLKLLRYDAGLSVSQEEDCPEIGSAVLLS
jgi:CSLREA domain-containing protein